MRSVIEGTTFSTPITATWTRGSEVTMRPLPSLVTRTTVPVDRKSTRLNSSHLVISYAVFCLKKKKTLDVTARDPRHAHRAQSRSRAAGGPVEEQMWHLS